LNIEDDLLSTRILLIRPLDKYKLKPAWDISLGLMYLGSVLERAGYDVQIYDAPAQIDFSDFRKEKSAENLLRASLGAVENQIRERKPDIVGITNRFSTQLEVAIAVAEIVKKIDPAILTVIGGNHASARPHTFFEETQAIDIACIGEGENTILEIAEYRQGKKSLKDVKGIAFREDGEVIVTERRDYMGNLDDLPLPAYNLLNLEWYFDAARRGLSGRSVFSYRGSHRAISMITSRGCPYRCVFCSIHLHMGRK
jgi:anaerobic magnesium-protoporphyrin IX monomethyl ester cyclase